MPEFDLATVRAHAEAALVRAGVAPAAAAVVADHLLTADLWGRQTHGLALRLPYVLRLARQGVGRGEPRLARDDGATALVDAAGSFGYVAALRCAELLAERASAHGLAAVALRGACHTGMIGFYLERVARAGMAAMGFANSCPLLAPAGGGRALLGTNPITFAFPAEPDPVLIDLATSAISYGELMRRQSAGEPLPPDCALDAQGRPTRDPAAAREGALLPFGGAKGGALALAVQILTGVLAGGPAVPPPGRDYALLFVGLRRGVFAGDAGYDRLMAELLAAYTAVPPLGGGQVRVPGWQRFENRRRREGNMLSIPADLARLLGLRG